MAFYGYLISIFCGNHIHSGKMRYKENRFRHCNSDKNRRCAVVCVYHGMGHRLCKNPPCNQPKIPALPASLRDGNGRVLDLLLQGALPRQCEQGCTDRQI